MGFIVRCVAFAEELTGRFRSDKDSPPAIAINDAAHITCVGNDYSFLEIYSRYIDAMGKRNILLAISTSGDSENIIRACKSAKKRE